MALLLIMSALISGSEVAFFSLSPTQINHLKNKKSINSATILKLLQNPHNLLATILIGNNLVNIGIIIFSSIITNTIFNFDDAKTIGFLLQIVGLTFILLLFGEIIPKVYANHNSLRFAHIMSIPIYAMGKFFNPLCKLLIQLSVLVNKPFIPKEVSMDDISYALDITSDSMSSEKDILQSIVKLRNTDVEEIMKSRVDVVAIEITKSFKEIKEKIVQTRYSRIPVYIETFDNVKGILYVKDLLPHIQKTNFRWQTLIRPPYYVPYTKKIDDLLVDFQESKVHLAIVIDEYGGTSGIITLDDILEEIVGELNDEFDNDEFEYTEIAENIFLFDGKFLLNDFYKVVNVENTIFDEIKGEADTLAGLILEIKGDFPELFEEIHFKSFTFKIEAEDKRRIQKIKVTINS
jgi:putative hemolysin